MFGTRYHVLWDCTHSAPSPNVWGRGRQGGEGSEQGGGGADCKGATSGGSFHRQILSLVVLGPPNTGLLNSLSK